MNVFFFAEPYFARNIKKKSYNEMSDLTIVQCYCRLYLPYFIAFSSSLRQTLLSHYNNVTHLFYFMTLLSLVGEYKHGVLLLYHENHRSYVGEGLVKVSLVTSSGSYSYIDDYWRADVVVRESLRNVSTAYSRI